jgi:FAD binding domain/Berberine and berberine like
MTLAICCRGQKSVSECVQSLLTNNTFKGDIDLRGSPGYAEAVDIDNVRVVSLPGLVLSPATQNDVAAALDATQRCNASFSVLSGGHGAAGYSLNSGGVVLNMRRHYANVELSDDALHLRVQSGARWDQVYAVLIDQTDRLAVGGGCPQVGVGGYFSGGGWSFLSRSYGLAIDQLVSARIVLADGRALTLSADENSSLFWAVRGGGGGNFGVLLSFTINTVKPRTPLMLAGQLCWPPFGATVLEVWSHWLKLYPHMPDYMDLDPVFLPLGANGELMFCFTVVCNGDAERECAPLVDPIVAQFPPAINSLKAQRYLDWQSRNVSVTDAQEGLLYLTSGMLEPGALTLPLVAELVAALRVAPSEHNLVLFHVGGGAIASVPANATAFPWRNTMLVVQIKAIWSDPSSAVAAANIAWVHAIRSLLLPHLNGSYVNYIDRSFPDWPRAYYGQNYCPLVHIKRTVDPRNFFSFPQSIGSEIPSLCL